MTIPQITIKLNDLSNRCGDDERLSKRMSIDSQLSIDSIDSHLEIIDYSTFDDGRKNTPFYHHRGGLDENTETMTTKLMLPVSNGKLRNISKSRSDTHLLFSLDDDLNNQRSPTKIFEGKTSMELLLAVDSPPSSPSIISSTTIPPMITASSPETFENPIYHLKEGNETETNFKRVEKNRYSFYRKIVKRKQSSSTLLLAIKDRLRCDGGGENKFSGELSKKPNKKNYENNLDNNLRKFDSIEKNHCQYMLQSSSTSKSLLRTLKSRVPNP